MALKTKIVNPHNKHVIRKGFKDVHEARKYADKYLKQMDYQIVIYEE